MLRFQYDRTTGPRARFVLSRARMRLLLALAILTLAPIAAAQPAPTPAPTAAPPAPEAEPPPDPTPAADPRLDELQARIDALEQKLQATPAAPAPVAKVETVQQAPAEPGADWSGFRFGSYGRVIAGSDLRGGKPAPIHVVAHGPRIVEKSYLELDFAYGIPFSMNGQIRTVTTLAFDDKLFHDTGAFSAGPAIRNLYAIAILGDFHAWVGSRMLRGDDLYLFDYWPLDDLNTLGAGIGATVQHVEVAAHVGVNRLLDPFQYQEHDVADPELGATTVVQLDRERMIASGSVAYTRPRAPTALSLRAKLYAELHGLPAGERRRGDATLEALPRDFGTTLGVELSAWGLAAPDSHHVRQANLFARWSKGLAAFDELAAPTSFDSELKTFPAASELVLGLGGNWDDAWGHVTGAAYARRFVDADRNERDRDDGWEYAVDVRPALRIPGARGLHAAIDLAYEARFPRGLQPTTQAAADPAIASIAPMLTFAPTGPSAFDRPELRVVYRAAHQNDGALALYPAADPRAIAWTHFLGVEAEWWFNSNSYR